MREARAWVGGEFWPATIEDYAAVASNPADPHNAFLRQVVSYWEMAAAMVVHGAVSAELFIDCNAEGFYILAKFAHILPAIREKNPAFFSKTSELVNRFAAAASRYEAVARNVEARRGARGGEPEAGGSYFFPPKA
jgi:Golgi nucleoside diphosphatase